MSLIPFYSAHKRKVVRRFWLEFIMANWDKRHEPFMRRALRVGVRRIREHS